MIRLLSILVCTLCIPQLVWAKDTFKNCSNAQRKVVKAAIKEARTHLPTVTKAVKDALKKGYGKSIDKKLKKAKKKLKKIQKNLDDGHTYNCRPESYTLCQGRTAQTSGFNVNLCGSGDHGFWSGSQTRQASVIVHELAHITGAWGDPAYFPGPKKGWPIDIRDRNWAEIADTYQWWFQYGFCMPEKTPGPKGVGCHNDPSRKKPAFQTCSKDSECISGACDERCFSRDSGDEGDPCRADGECKNGLCSGGWKSPGKCKIAKCKNKNAELHWINKNDRTYECRHKSKFYTYSCPSGYTYSTGKCTKTKTKSYVPKCSVPNYICVRKNADGCFGKKKCKGKFKKNVTCSSAYPERVMKRDYEGQADRCIKKTVTTKNRSVTKCPAGWSKSTYRASSGANGYEKFYCKTAL